MRWTFPLALLCLFTVTACSNDSGSILDPSVPDGGTADGGTNSGGTGGGGTTGGGGSVPNGPAPSTPSDSASRDGTWSSPDGTIPTITPIDSSVFAPAGSGAGATSGSSTTLMFQTSGSARYGTGTCRASGVWTSPDGFVSGPHNPNCLLYVSDNRVGNNGKGACVESRDGYAGLWLNPQLHPTAPYHTNCLQLGTASTTLALSFPAQAQLYEANDGSGARVLDFVSGGTAHARLVYHGAADGTTTGAGVLVGTDGQGRLWTIDFGQPALSYTGSVSNGDLVSALVSGGVQVVACNGGVGCSLVQLAVSVAP